MKRSEARRDIRACSFSKIPMLEFCVELIVADDSCAEKCCVMSRDTKRQNVVQM
jgi:hypothetical protein